MLWRWEIPARCSVKSATVTKSSILKTERLITIIFKVQKERVSSHFEVNLPYLLYSLCVFTISYSIVSIS